MHRASTIENRLLPERVRGQIFGFVDLLESYNSRLPAERQRSPEDYRYLRHFFPAFVTDRNSRAEEVKSPEYQAVSEIAHEALPMSTLAVMCMDGRVKMIHAFGFSADIGSAIRVPGGILKDFVRGPDGKLRLDKGTSFAKQLDSAVSKNRHLAEVFDSHWGCAAQGKEEKARGKKPEDGGLFSDVLYKREMADATRLYVVEKHLDARHLSLIQTTFNPVTGYMYMGLETDEALAFARERAGARAKEHGRDHAVPVYSKEVIRSMIEEGLVVSTGQLIELPAVREAFDQHFFEVSWKDDYITSAKKFWEGINSMRDVLFPVLKRNLVSIYPGLQSMDKGSQRELEERAMLLLANSFNAFLHNRDHNEAQYLDMSDEDYEKQEHYEYDRHREEGVKISRGGHPVYDIAMLVINSEDKETMAADLEFGSEIVRENRLLGRIKDSSGVYETPEDFAAAPVPVVMQEIITDPRLTEKDWQALDEIDWTGIQDLPWDKWTSSEFAEWLGEKAKLQNSISTAIDRLRINMATIFDRNSQSSAHLVDQYKVALPIVCGADRETHAVIPFVKLGQ